MKVVTLEKTFRPRPAAAALLLFLVVIFLSFPAARAVELRYGGKIRVRGWELRNRSLVVRLTDEQSQAASWPIREEQNFFDMRARFYGEAVTGGDLKITANARFEIGDLVFGDKKRGSAGRSSGSALGADGVNLETKNLYLDLDYAKWGVGIRGGIFPLHVPLVFATDAAGVQLRGHRWGVRAEGTFIKAASNTRYDLDGNGLVEDRYYDFDFYSLLVRSRPLKDVEIVLIYALQNDASNIPTVLYGDPNEVSYYEARMHWLGGTVEVARGISVFRVTGLYNIGWTRLVEEPHGYRDTRAFAVDTTLEFSLPWVGPKLFWHYGSGDDPATADSEAFADVMPEFERTSILIGGNGGYALMNFSASGTTAAGFSLDASPVSRLSARFVYLHAWLSEAPDVSGNRHFLSADQNLGDEIDLELAYRPVEALKIMAMANVFIQAGGYRAHFDSPSGGPILEVMAGMQYKFQGKIPDLLGRR